MNESSLHASAQVVVYTPVEDFFKLDLATAHGCPGAGELGLLGLKIVVMELVEKNTAPRTTNTNVTIPNCTVVLTFAMTCPFLF